MDEPKKLQKKVKYEDIKFSGYEPDEDEEPKNLQNLYPEAPDAVGNRMKDDAEVENMVIYDNSGAEKEEDIIAEEKTLVKRERRSHFWNITLLITSIFAFLLVAIQLINCSVGVKVYGDRAYADFSANEYESSVQVAESMVRYFKFYMERNSLAVYVAAVVIMFATLFLAHRHAQNRLSSVCILAFSMAICGFLPSATVLLFPGISVDFVVVLAIGLLLSSIIFFVYNWVRGDENFGKRMYAWSITAVAVVVVLIFGIYIGKKFVSRSQCTVQTTAMGIIDPRMLKDDEGPLCQPDWIFNNTNTADMFKSYTWLIRGADTKEFKFVENYEKHLEEKHRSNIIIK